MNLAIAENTKIANGSITIDGRKRKYLITINKGDSFTVAVDLVIYNSLGSIVDSMSRCYSRVDHAYNSDVVKAALAEYKEFQS